MEDPKSWMLWLIGTAIPGVLTALGSHYWLHRKDQADREQRRDAREDLAEERHETRIGREREQLAAANAALLSNLRNELDRERAAREEVEAERDQEWRRSRTFYDYMRHFCHEARHARQMAESLTRLRGDPPPVWVTSIELPPFDAPKS